MSRPRRTTIVVVVALAACLACAAPAFADDVIADDLIVQGDGCFGITCADGEDFGPDTLRAKDDVPRLGFDDTSAGVGDPLTDWALQAGDSANGGLERFLLQNVTGNTTPFSIRANAPDDALTVGVTSAVGGQRGSIGIGTPTPQLPIHMRNLDTPAIRFDQAAGPFTAQTWDIGANEANFFVRDLTGGSRLPFRIRPGAPTSSVDIAASGNVGVGAPTPTQPLHVRRVDGTARALVEEASTTAATRVLADLSNNGPAQLRLTNTAPGTTDWLAGGADASDFAIRPEGASFAPLTLTPSGTVRAGGALTQPADPAGAENPAPVDGPAVLQALRGLDLQTREYTADSANLRHLWPTAGDFSAAFNVGANDGSVAPGDMAGVALAAVKALDARVTAIAAGPQGPAGNEGPRGPAGPAGPAGALTRKTANRITRLETRNRRLQTQIKALDKRVRNLEKDAE